MGLDMNMYLRKVGDKNYANYEELAYWRKANQIHAWIEDHVAGGNLEDCTDYVVPMDKLKELYILCRDILEETEPFDSKLTPKGVEMAREKLPTRSGFFFGSQDYDRGYTYDLEETVRQLKPIITEYDGRDDVEIIYHAWW